MAKVLNASHYCLIWTFISTLIVYVIFGLTILTAVCFCSGAVLSIINFIAEEITQKEKKNKAGV